MVVVEVHVCVWWGGGGGGGGVGLCERSNLIFHYQILPDMGITST